MFIALIIILTYATTCTLAGALCALNGYTVDPDMIVLIVISPVSLFPLLGLHVHLRLRRRHELAEAKHKVALAELENLEREIKQLK
jgi:hypothetical protein